jgi:hypothetical protein
VHNSRYTSQHILSLDSHVFVYLGISKAFWTMGLQTAPDNNGLRMDTTILLQLSKIASYFTTSTYITPNELKLPIQTKFQCLVIMNLNMVIVVKKFVMPP